MLPELQAHKQSTEIKQVNVLLHLSLIQPATPRGLHPGLDVKAPSRHQHLLYTEEPILY